MSVPAVLRATAHLAVVAGNACLLQLYRSVLYRAVLVCGCSKLSRVDHREQRASPVHIAGAGKPARDTGSSQEQQYVKAVIELHDKYPAGACSSFCSASQAEDLAAEVRSLASLDAYKQVHMGASTCVMYCGAWFRSR